MIRKHVKSISTLLTSALLCSAVSIPSFAGQVTASNEKSGKYELASYRSVLTENRDTLGELLEENKNTMNDIRELQKELKEAGILTDDDRTELASQSAEIQEKQIDARQELTELLETKLSTLKAAQ